MTFSIDKRSKIVFLSQHLMGPQLDENDVMKAVKCARVEYNIGSIGGKNRRM